MDQISSWNAARQLDFLAVSPLDDHIFASPASDFVVQLDSIVLAGADVYHPVCRKDGSNLGLRLRFCSGELWVRIRTSSNFRFSGVSLPG
jgi:hypothetical protein